MKSLLTVILSVYLLSPLIAQESYIDSVLNEVMYYDDNELINVNIEVDKAYHFLYVNTSYSNKTYYAGREIGDPQYFLAAQISYFNSHGFFAGLGTSSGTLFSTSGNANYNNAIMVGYGKALKKNKWFRYNMSYSRYIAISNDIDYSSTYNNNLHMGATTRFKWFGARASLNYLFGGASKATLNWDVYASIRIADFGSFNNLQFVPEISFFYDSEDVVYATESEEFTYNSEFGWMNTEITFPLMLNINNFDLEIAYTYNLPRSLDPIYEYNNTSLFSFSIGYIFDM
ncbi:hypothetical protein [Saccharicrinis aurantiacus]|uniref:hypothetical protein n=1 Tax=Saccharicrinis aurantiacus TaxID=1849719 RepID=UPI000837D4A9|nr:hypothetical protein [Saccharicrinis aurantiacus]